MTAKHSGRSLHGQTFEMIGRRILSGEIADGETIDEDREDLARVPAERSAAR